MEKKLTGVLLLCLMLNQIGISQVDTSWVYNPSTPYGPLDIRIARSSTDYYYLQDGETFSFRESAPGVRTNTFYDMTTWDSSPYQEGHLREKRGTADMFVMNYRLLAPEEYDPGFAEGYPIVIVLHGYGERANCAGDVCYHDTRGWLPATNTPPAPTNVDNELLNNDHNLLHGGQRHLAAVRQTGGKLPGDATLDPKSFPGFVLFPQSLNGWDHLAVQDAIRLLRLIIKKYNIDENRVFIEGLSNGGHGMFEAIKRAPWLFAAAIGMSAIDDGFINSHGVAHTISHIPLWLFQGGMDQMPSPGKTARYVQQFRSVGADVRYTLYPELGHGTWNKAFNEPDFFSWMLGKNKSEIHTFENTTFICSEKGTPLQLSSGFMAYQWQFNGQTIAGADSATFYATTPGTYRARFSRVANPTEGQWNQWSRPITLTATDPPRAAITQNGTVLLTDLNGSTDARLQSAEEQSRYYWYKDGVPIDFPGSGDDTLRFVAFTPSYGNGSYTLVVLQSGCLSEPSEAKNIFFENSAPINILAPTNFTGISTSPSENTLSWTDASTDEGGFEIWRRKTINNNGTDPWEMAGIAPANTTTFDDSGVEPTMRYEYKIRAVSGAGRSEYTPADPAAGLVVQTVLDTEAPTAPTELTAADWGVGEIRLSWEPSSDNTRIREYYIYYNNDSVSTGSSDTTFVLTNLPPNVKYDIHVKAVDLSRNLSSVSNTVEMSTFFSGLYYEHTTGSWISIDSVDWSWSEFRGTVASFTLSPKTQDDYYNFSFDGYLLIESEGNYEFRVHSSDGSRLWLDGQLLVDNDGLHDLTAVASPATSFEAGPHRIYLQYFEYTGVDSLYVEYKGPDTANEWSKISHEVLKSDKSLVTAIGDPDNGPEDSFVVSIFPNPTTQDNIRVMVETVLPAPVRVRLLDLTGSNLFEGIYQAEEIVHGISLSPEGLMNTGMYLVMVEQGGLVVRKKVVVKRE